MKNVTVLENPLIKHKIGIIRDKRTGTKEFREIISELSTCLCYEALSDAKLTEEVIDTPICKTTVQKINEKDYAFFQKNQPTAVGRYGCTCHYVWCNLL